MPKYLINEYKLQLTMTTEINISQEKSLDISLFQEEGKLPSKFTTAILNLGLT